jgi:hypothetical protein
MILLISEITKIMGEDFCLADSAKTHTILKDEKYFRQLTLSKANTISSSLNLIEGFGRANIMLPKGTKICIDDALYSSKSRRNLVSFKDIRYNDYYHIETNNEASEKYFYITLMVLGQKLVLEKTAYFFSWVILYNHEDN